MEEESVTMKVEELLCWAVTAEEVKIKKKEEKEEVKIKKEDNMKKAEKVAAGLSRQREDDRQMREQKLQIYRMDMGHMERQRIEQEEK
eukprot:4868734-Ditylum_brightwellii.AAC.2